MPRRRLPALAAPALALVLATGYPVHASEHPPGERFESEALKEDVEILVDEWGVPHIYAQNTDDLFFAQGFNIARDRLFQIDLWRRQGLGELSSAFGPEFVEHDTAARHLLYRGDMKEEWRSYPKPTRNAVTRFTEGINQYISLARDVPGMLPPEFTEHDYLPERWAPEDVVRIRSHSLASNVESEVARAVVTCHAGPRAHLLDQALRPERELSVPDGLDPCDVPADVLDSYLLATEPVSLDTGGAPDTLLGPVAGEGSNTWTVSGENTATGRPILANDPHRATLLPSTRYIVHLSAPGTDVVGAGEPIAPGISLGHNGSVAFGLTSFEVDQEDLYVYELNPDDPNEYLYQGEWESFETDTETVAVRGREDVEVDVSFTRHGPVLHRDLENDRAFALRTTWLEPGTSPYLGALGLMGASDFDDFSSTVRRLGGPPLNYSYADADGDIGWRPGGMAPQRVGYDGLLPVPGDGSFDWDGFHGGARLPQVHNPPNGFYANANNLPIPDGSAPDYGFQWAAPYRYDRITEVLSSSNRHTVASMADLQLDEVSLPAREIVPLLEGLETEDASARAAIALLQDWPGHVASADSAEAALFETWIMAHLAYTVINVALPRPAAEQILTPDISTLIDVLHDPEPWFGPEGELIRDQLMVSTLGLAYDDVAGRLGDDPGQWRWGDLHQTVFTHAAGDDVGPFGRGGGWETVNMSVFHPVTYQQIVGATTRVVIDVGSWDDSLATNAPGQSGDPRSPFHQDLAPLWSSGEFFPLLYSRDAVEQHTRMRIVLRAD
ncbi:penicillin acylase family protein [Nocardiopsis alborubida]|uniref:Penicillin acylase family protein n=1 Tax=Nocardiopsis alborubida TaxID=146802 RepID=A0A7X6MHD4_9ACTN|nr:penicillin acylase family protein [Nocardiopsis alborubida]NKZ01362.1 penicillin acylase family protein [Nocardiopsis alborubida]